MFDRVVQLRQPAYTGSNRCWPCTLLNGGLLFGFAMTVAIVSIEAAIAVVLIGVVVITLRGYLVPYTPWFGARIASLLPWSIHPGRRASDSVGNPDGADPDSVLAALVEADVLIDDGERLQPSEAFAKSWEEQMAELSALAMEELPPVIRETVPAVGGVRTVDHETRQYVVLDDGSGSVTGESWVRHPKAIAETAAIRVMREHAVDQETLLAAADPLCLFLGECPVCQESLEARPASGCCGSPQTDSTGRPVMAPVCPACGTRFQVTVTAQ